MLSLNQCCRIRIGSAMVSVLLSAAIFFPAANAQVHIDTIALTGREAPGFEPLAHFTAYIDGNWNSGFFEHRRPYINNSGQVLFGGQAYSYPLGDLHDDGVWVSEADGQLRLVRRERMAAVGTNSSFGECGDFDQNDICKRQHPDDGMSLLGLSDDGKGVFLSGLVGPDVDRTNFRGIWSERGGDGLRVVARMGDPMPGLGDAFGRIRTSIGRANPPNPTNDDGLVTFSSEFASDRNRGVLWVEQPSGDVRPVVKTDDPAPGTNGHFVDEEFIGHIDAQGNVAFDANYRATADEFGRGIWLGTDQNLIPVVVTGDPVPGIAEDLSFDSVFLRSSSDAGNLAFTGQWRSEPDENGLSRWFSGVFAKSGNEIRKVEREGGAEHVVIDDLGRVALIAGTEVYAERNGALTLVAGPGMLPGLADNETLLEVRNLSSNASGDLVFSAYFNVECDFPDDPFQCADDGGEGHWIVGQDSEVSLIARTGGSIEITPGDQREVYRLGAFNGTQMNDLGQVAFMTQFLDGTQGVFRAQIAEPLDCNGDGLVNSLDLACQTDVVLLGQLVVELGVLLGDFDGINGVDFADFLKLSENFGLSAANYGDGDVNLDGLTDFADFLELSQNFGLEASSGIDAVPEPRFYFALLGFGLLGLCRTESGRRVR